MRRNVRWIAAAAAVFCIATASPAAEVVRGYQQKVTVAAPTRLDWIYPLANQSPAETPADWLEGYDSTEQSYELFVPKNDSSRKPAPAVIFISPGDAAMGYKHWEAACDKLGIIFAGPHNAGNNCPAERRVRIVLDVLDDVRRNYNIDADRTYIAGFSGGGRVACQIAFALPEYFGGVIPVCAAGDLRPESWLRQRVIDRLSVAFITGETDFNRGEIERFRGPILAEVGVRTKNWVIPRLGHGVPGGNEIVEVHKWLDEAAKTRGALAKKYPASRIPRDKAPTRAEWAAALLDEGKSRLEKPDTLYSGLMQIKGAQQRWPDVPAATEALKILTEYDSRAQRPWDEDDIAEQRRFLVAQARGIDAYATGELPQQYAQQRLDMLKAALNLWQVVLQDGQDKKAAAEAAKHIPLLLNRIAEEEKQ